MVLIVIFGVSCWAIHLSSFRGEHIAFKSVLFVSTNSCISIYLMLNGRGMGRDHVKRCSALDFLLSSWPSYICLQLIKYNHSLGFLFCRLYAEFVGYLSARDSFGGGGRREAGEVGRCRTV